MAEEKAGYIILDKQLYPKTDKCLQPKEQDPPSGDDVVLRVLFPGSGLDEERSF